MSPIRGKEREPDMVRLVDEIKRWRQVFEHVRDTQPIEVHVCGVIAGLIVIADAIRNRDQWGASS